MKYSLSEYSLYISLRFISLVLGVLPLKVAIYLGRLLGGLIYYLNRKQRNKAYKNLRIALAKSKTIPELKRILKECFENFFMNMFEILRTIKIDRDYIRKNIEIEGEENLREAQKMKKGVIVLGIHSGNWELCFSVAGILGYPFNILAEEQIKNPLLDGFLNRLRESKGTRILKAGSSTRELINLLNHNKIVGLVADHGVKKGVSVEFFNRKVLTPVGAIRLALKLDSVLLLAYIRRIKGTRHKITIMPAFKLNRSSDVEKDILNNLRLINKTFEKIIEEYPSEYYWPFKRFKYSQDREILVLTDGITGHLRQTEACLKLINELAKEKGLEIKTTQVKAEFKNRVSRNLQAWGVGLASRSSCQGCLFCLKTFLKEESFLKLQSVSPDLVISCGSSLGGINFVISSENQAKSVVIMRPGILSTRRFDLVIMPRHDNPPARKNIILSQGALNLTDESSVEQRAKELQRSLGLRLDRQTLAIGLLIGGDTRSFSLKKETIREMITQIKSAADVSNADIFVTTSRRTSPAIEDLVKKELEDYTRCKLLIIANQKNIPNAVGGILGLSQIVVVTPESISMISEAASAGRYVVVFGQDNRLGKRHRRFLNNLNRNGYIYLCQAASFREKINDIISIKPPIKVLQDNLVVRERLKELL